MDKQLYILLILHFAVKEKDGQHSSDNTYLFTGLTQNKTSQYFTGISAMPRSSRIALSQHIMRSLGVKKQVFKWLDDMDTNYLDNVYVKTLISYIKENGKLSPPRGRTKKMALLILEKYNMLLNESEK